MLIKSKHEGYRRDGVRLYPKGNNTPPPDPELVESQTNNLNSQTAATDLMAANQAALLPYQIQQMQFGLHAAETAFADSREDRAYSLERRGHLTGLQDQMISDATDFNSGERGEQLAGDAMADVGLQYGQARQAQERSMQRMGVNPNSSKFAQGANQNSLGLASSQAAAGKAARDGARQEGYGLTDRATNALSGYPAMGMNTTSASTASGLAGIGAVNQAANGIQNGYGNISRGYAGAAGTAGNIYGQQLSAWNAGQQAASQEDANIWGAVGTAAAMYGGYLMFSDEDIKEDRKKVDPELSLSMIKKIPASESWRYKKGSEADDGGRKHVGPMAQDVQASMGDDVAPGGKQIDLISLNGHTMNAIKALDKKVDKAISLSNSIKRKG